MNLKMKNGLRRAALGLLAAAGLQACGGGGGGAGTPDTPPIIPPAAEPQLRLLSAALDGEAERRDRSELTERSAELSLTGTSSAAPPHFKADADGEALETATSVEWDAATGRVKTRIKLRSDLAPGLYKGGWTLSACHDAACQRPFAGSPQTLSYQHRILPGFELSDDAVEFNSSTEEQAPASRIKVSLPVMASGWTYQVIDAPGGSAWLQHSATGDQLELQPRPGLPSGVYKADVKLSALGVERPARLVSVKATVESQVKLLYTPTFALGSLSVTPGASMRVLVTAAGPKDLSWKASTATPWLRIEQATGTALVWRLVPEAFEKLSNGSYHMASVDFQFSHGLPARTVSFRVLKRLAQIDRVDDSALQAGRAGSLVLHGTGFSDLTRALPQLLSLEGVAPTGIKILDNGRIQVDLPAQAAGRYALTLGTASGLPGQHGSYTVR